MKKYQKILIISVLLLVGFFIFYQVASASIFGGLEGAREVAGFSEDTNIYSRVGMLISVFLGFVGVIFLGLTLYGGLIWMLARGNEQEIEKAKRLIESAVIGLAIVLAAYAITYFVIQRFAPAPSTGGGACAEGEIDCAAGCAPDTFPEVLCVPSDSTCTCTPISGAGGGAGTCSPITSCPAGYCGIILDGCGGVFDCPSCPTGQICSSAHTCISAPTEETGGCNCCTGSRAGQTMSECVSFCSSRGGITSWNGAPTGRSCPSGGGGGAPPCPPTTCAAEGAECGSISDGCSGSLSCGSCSSAEYSCISNRCELAYADCTCCADGISVSDVTLGNCVAACLAHGGTKNWGSTSRSCP